MGRKRKNEKSGSQTSDISGNNSKVFVKNVSSSQKGQVDKEKDTKVMSNIPANTDFVQQKFVHSTPVVQQFHHSQPTNASFQLPMLSYNTSPVCGYPPPVSHINENRQSQFDTLNYSDKIDQLSAKLDFMCGKLKKLDEIDSRMSSFESSIGAVLQEVTKLKSQTSEMEKGLTFMNDKFEQSKKDVSDIKREVNDLVRENSTLKDEVLNMSTDLQSLKERQIELQSRTMRDNLIFTGIPENETEDTEKVLADFIKNKLEITKDIEFERVHRMGKKIQGKLRPVIAKFSKFKDREIVRKQAPTVLKRTENKEFGVNEQYPKEINDRRKELYPYLKSAKRNGKRANLVLDKLYVDGKLFDPVEDARTTHRGLSPNALEFTPREIKRDVPREQRRTWKDSRSNTTRR